jgi:hypothetical protein
VNSHDPEPVPAPWDYLSVQTIFVLTLPDPAVCPTQVESSQT